MQKASLSWTLNIACKMSTREVSVANRAFSFEKFSLGLLGLFLVISSAFIHFIWVMRLSVPRHAILLYIAYKHFYCYDNNNNNDNDCLCGVLPVAWQVSCFITCCFPWNKSFRKDFFLRLLYYCDKLRAKYWHSPLRELQEQRNHQAGLWQFFFSGRNHHFCCKIVFLRWKSFFQLIFHYFLLIIHYFCSYMWGLAWFVCLTYSLIHHHWISKTILK